MNDECGNCRFWALYRGSEERGICRKNPPKVIGETSMFGTVFSTRWPEVKSDSWCGEHQKRTGGK